jgi:hypothetical protein
VHNDKLKNHGYEPQGNPRTQIQRQSSRVLNPPPSAGFLPAAGRVQLSILIHYVLKIEVSRIKIDDRKVKSFFNPVGVILY